MSSGEHAADLVQESLANTWWGDQPWRRYVRLLALIGPMLVVERVAAVTNFSRTQAWPILVSLDLANWLQIVTGSFVAWFPWSLAFIATVVAAFGTWAGVQTIYATGIVEIERRKPVMIATYSHFGLIVAAMILPLAAAGLLASWLPRPLWVVPAIGAAGGWFLISESLSDEYRVARIEFVGRKHMEGRATVADKYQARLAGLHLRVSSKAREDLSSLLILIAGLAALASLGWMLNNRTPWVPEECIVYGKEGQQTMFRGYLLIEGNQTDLVLRAGDRVVLSIPAALLSTSSTC